MTYILINLAAILAATGAGLVFGLVWYFGIDRRRSSRTSRSAPAPGIGLAVTAFIAEFWLASILAGALILAPPEAGVWTMTIGSAVIIWIGFVVPVLTATYRLRGLALRTAATDCGHWLGVMLVQACVLRLIGLVAPG